MNFDNNMKYKNNDSSNLSVSLSYFPKIEMIAKKGIDDNYNLDDRKIDVLMSKYVPNTLSEKIKNMSDQVSAKIYFTLSEGFKTLSKNGLYPVKTNDLSLNYLKRASIVYTSDVKNAYKQFDLYYTFEPCFDGAKVAELCLKLSNYEDTEQKFVKIYTYLGNFYDSKKMDYKRAIECYENVLKYSNSNSEDYQGSKLNIATLYSRLGDYQKAYETVNEVRDYEPYFPPGFDKDTAKRFKSIMLENWHSRINEIKCKIQKELTKSHQNLSNNSINAATEEEIDIEDIYVEDIDSVFKGCLQSYSKEILSEAYSHYFKANQLCYKNKHLEAIDEFKIVKQIIPEKTRDIDIRICMLINSNTVEDDNKEYYYNEKIQILHERMEIALKSNDTRELCDVYNELGCTYGELNANDKELEYFKKAVNIAGIASIYGTNLANSYVHLGLYDEAINIYTNIKKTAPSFAERDDINVDYEISRINDLKLGKLGNKGNVNQLAIEHSQKGDEYFNEGNYEQAFIEYNNACEIVKNEINYLIKMILQKEMYECSYLSEMEIVSKAFMICEEKDRIEFLPFLLTLCGDYLLYEGLNTNKQAQILYELAIYLLNLVPIGEKFAAPYYKLALMKEQEKKYEEAFTIFQFTNIIDKSYNAEEDINRVRLLYSDNGISNSRMANKLIEDMESYLKSISFSEVIQTGKKALVYEPNNLNIYYLICKAYDSINVPLDKNKYYEFKWMAREGLRLNSIKAIDSIDSNFFLWCLGKCCTYEKKYKQAEYFYECIVDNDVIKDKEIADKALKELIELRKRS